jgi:ribose-phosphate pyrophosphokinase
MKIFSGTSNKTLAENIAKNLNLKLSGLEVFVFPDGEKRVRILDKVLGEDTVIIQSTSTPVDENYMQLFFAIDALKRNGAKSVTAVVPYFGYQRQDHMFRIGEDVSVKVIAQILDELKLDKLIAVDFHSPKIREAFSVSVVELSALPVFADVIKKENWNNSTSVLVTPDMGGIRRIKILSELLNSMPYITVEKNRDLVTGDISAEKLSGEVRKRAIIVDDMIASGKTVSIAASLLRKNGAKEIYVFATHAVFSKEATEILQNSEINGVYVADTVFVQEEKKFPKLEILSVAKLVAKELFD